MPYDIGKAFERIEKELMQSMIRNMEHHKAEETKEGFEWSQWQVEQLRALEEYRKRNNKKFPKKFQDINSKIPHLVKEARAAGQMDQEADILEAISKGFRARKGSGDITGAFFEVNDRKLNALIDATTNDFERAEVAILRRAEDQYRQVIFDAQVYANAGGTTYEKAVDMATKDFISKGIDCIEYKNGARHTLSDYADMAIKTAVKRAYLTGEGEKRKEWGIATVIVNKRGNPCPKCAPFCGKVMIDDVWSGGSRKDGPYPLMSTAVRYGLYHPRCRDSHTTYFPGISTAEDKWSKEELEEIGANYEADQRQQYAKRQADKYERLADTRLDPENKRQCEAKADRWQREAVRLQRRANSSDDPFERMFYDRQAQNMGEISQNKNLQNTFRGAKFKEEGHPKRYEDITDRWFPDEIPGSHEVERLPKLFIGGVEHRIDGHHIKFNYDKHELEIAKMLARDVGGQVYMRPKIDYPLGQPSADYEFNGILYDLKTLRPNARNNTIFNRVKKCEGQANRFIIDVSKTELTDDSIENQISKIFWSKDTKFIDEIVIVKNYQIHRVARRK